MRRLWLVILTALCISACIALPAGQAQASTWTAVQGGNIHYHAVDFFDALRGWVGGTTYIPEGMVGFEDTAVISRTASAGAGWESVSRHEVGEDTSVGWNFLTVTALDFVDDSRGWASLSDGTILASVTGGASWVVQAEGSGGYADNNWGYPGLSMADATHGVAVGGWVGFMGTTYPRMAYTADGVGWLEADFDKPAGAALEAACMVDSEYGWAVGTAVQADGMPLVLVTHDGGATWARQTGGLPTDGTGFHGVSFAGRERGWAVGDRGAVFATTDGGETWLRQESGTTETLLDVCFTGATAGWAVGEKGTILETTQAGSPWVAQSSGTSVTLRDVAVAGMVVWAVGDEGTILKTAVPPPAGIPTFSDIALSPYKTAIESLAAAGILNGFPDGTFRPGATITRAQFAKLIVGALGVVPSESVTTRFTDLGQPDANGYPHRYVQAAFDHAITTGVDQAQSRFSPWDPIRRDQVASMIVRGARRLMTGTLADPPASTESVFAGVPEPHGANLRVADHNGLLDGLVGMGTGWSVTANATRGEVAQMLFNLRLK